MDRFHHSPVAKRFRLNATWDCQQDDRACDDELCSHLASSLSPRCVLRLIRMISVAMLSVAGKFGALECTNTRQAKRTNEWERNVFPREQLI